jgi:hypothetical protein
VTDFLDEKRREINDRLAELKPLIDEYTRLQDAAAALAGVGGSAPRAAASTPAAATATPARRGPGRPRGSKTRATGARRGRPPKAAAAAAAAAPAAESASTATAAATPRRRAGRRKGSGTRAAQALQFVTGQPGITIPELAAKMNIKQNYLYRVLPGLEQEKKIKKQGRGWHPAS